MGEVLAGMEARTLCGVCASAGSSIGISATFRGQQRWLEGTRELKKWVTLLPFLPNRIGTR